MREAVDARSGTATQADRARALEMIRAMGGRFLSPDELGQLVEHQRRWTDPGRRQGQGPRAGA